MNRNIPQGLTHDEVEERKILGKQNIYKDVHKRTYIHIIKDNVFTFINILLAVISVLLVIFGRLSDGLIYFWVAVLNIGVSLFQEVNAKIKLDAISRLITPTTVVMRDGNQESIPSEHIVLDDCIILKAGSIVPADCLVYSGHIGLDESILTGESEEVQKHHGDEVLAGSLVVTGHAYCTVVRVGNNTISSKISNKAKQFTRFLTPIQKEVNVTIRILVACSTMLGVMVVMFTLLKQTPLNDSIQIAAVIIGVIPNSLFAMINLSYALGSVAVLQKGALVQKLNSIESLANVDVLCVDKTGTLTTKDLSVEHIEYVDTLSWKSLGPVLTHFSESFKDKNATLQAVYEYCQHNTASGSFTKKNKEVIPFHSRYKWSGVLFEDNSGVILGAADILLKHCLQPQNGLSVSYKEIVASYQSKGYRVLAVAACSQTKSLYDAAGNPKLPSSSCSIIGFIVLSDTIREHVRETISSFQKAGVEVKIISGDNPQTVYALTKQMGVFSEPVTVVHGFDITPESIADDALYGTIFGRITPDQKEALVYQLQKQGKYVAMIGDGVNDVMSLKAAQLGIAMESGSQTTKSVSDIVLLNDSFSSLPVAVIEGQKIRNGLINIFKLYLSRIIYLVMLYVAVFTVDLPFPFSVKQSSLVAFFAAGIPAVMLSLWTHEGKRSKDETLIGAVLTFVIPVSVITGVIAVCMLFGLTFLKFDIRNLSSITSISFAQSLRDSIKPLQTALVLLLTIIAQIIVLYIAPPLKSLAVSSRFTHDIRHGIVSILLVIGFLVLYTFEWFREFWDISLLSAPQYAVVFVAIALWWALVHVSLKYKLFEKFLDL